MLGLVAMLLAAAPARADTTPPDLTPSAFSCKDDNGGGLRPGDPVACTLIASMLGGTENATITATIPLPPLLNIDAAQPTPGYDDSTRTINWGPTILGFTFAGQQRVITLHLLVADDAAVGATLDLSADLQAVGAVDSAVVNRAVDTNTLAVSPPAAVLDESAITCSDVNGGTLLPGELVSCQLDVTDAADHEDADHVQGRIVLALGTWAFGGASLGPITAVFGTNLLGALASGATKSVTATFTLSPTVLGGTLVSAIGSADAVSTPSGAALSFSEASPPLVVAPGPAHLVPGSSLICIDTNGGVLLPGDDLTCNVTVAPVTGYEDVQGATATVQIPNHALWAGGGDSHDASSISFATSSLGDVAAGATKAAAFHLHIADGTAPDTVLAPTGSLSATSVPLGGPVQQALTGNFLTVGQVVVPDQPITVVTPPVVKPPVVIPPVVTAAKSYKLKARTIRFVMRSGHRRKNHLWHGSKRRFAFVKKFIVRTPAISGKVVRKVTVPKKGKWRPRHGKVTIKGTRLMYTLKKGVNPGTVKDRFHYTVTDTNGKKVTGTVVVSHKKG